MGKNLPKNLVCHLYLNFNCVYYEELLKTTGRIVQFLKVEFLYAHVYF